VLIQNVLPPTKLAHLFQLKINAAEYQLLNSLCPLLRSILVVTVAEALFAHPKPIGSCAPNRARRKVFG
jgi:hypothetical protein